MEPRSHCVWNKGLFKAPLLRYYGSILALFRTKTGWPQWDFGVLRSQIFSWSSINLLDLAYHSAHARALWWLSHRLWQPWNQALTCGLSFSLVCSYPRPYSHLYTSLHRGRIVGVLRYKRHNSPHHRCSYGIYCEVIQCLKCIVIFQVLMFMTSEVLW